MEEQAAGDRGWRGIARKIRTCAAVCVGALVGVLWLRADLVVDLVFAHAGSHEQRVSGPRTAPARAALPDAPGGRSARAQSF